MTKSLKRMLITSILFFVACLLTLSVVVFFTVADSGEKQIDNSVTFSLKQDLKEEYLRNDYFTVPSGEFEKDGQKILADSYLIYPDGRTSSYTENLLDEEGKYQITYTAVIEGDIQTQVYSFDVVSKPSSLFVADSSITFINNLDSSSYADGEYNGLGISFQEKGKTIHYDGVIDLSDNTSKDTFFEYMYIPEKNGFLEVKGIEIQLTDIYDSENYIKIRLSPHTSAPYRRITSIKATANTEVDYGWIGHNPGAVAGYKAGYDVLSCGYGKIDVLCDDGVSRPSMAVPLSLQFDYEEKKLLAQPSEIPSCVIDFDDPNFVGRGNEWKGFTTGEVYLDFTLLEMDSSVTSANILLLNVDGRNLGGEKLEDLSSPIINLDLKGNSIENLPYALIGTKFDVFDAMVYDDVDGFIYYYDVSVYFQDGSPILIQNGNFIPSQAGEYNIVYTAKDSSGKVSIRTEKILAYAKNVQELNYEFKNIPNKISVGIDYKIEDGFAGGGSGILKVERNLTFEGKDYEIVEEYFKPLYEGEYKLTYKLTDYLGQTKEFTHTMTASFLPVPVIEKVQLPSSLIKGSTYSFPIVKAYDYAAGREVFADLFVNGHKVDGYDYTLMEAGMLHVKYVAYSLTDENNYTVSEDYTITVKEIDKTDSTTFFSSYFDYDGMSLKTQKTDLLIEATAAKNKASFINPVPVKSFEILFNVVSNKNNFSSFVITLTDSENVEEKVQLKISKNSNKNAENSIFSVNNGLEANISGSFFGNTSKLFKVSLSSDGKVYDYNKNYVSTIEKYLNGKKFTGFSSNLVYVDFEFIDVNGAAAITLNQLSNQTFGNTTNDVIEPIIVLNNEYSQFFVSLNTEYTVYAAKAYDVLQFDAELKVKVTAPDGIVIYEGTINNEKTFALSQVGTYSIIYEAKDSYGRKAATEKYYVTVADVLPPTVSWTGNVPIQINRGDILNIPTFSFSDDVSENVFYMIYVVESSGKIVLIDESYQTVGTGRHTLWVYASDDFGNVTMNSFIFYVI